MAFDSRTTASASRPINILKPLKSADPGLKANLRSFFAQDHPRWELLFGVADGPDPAVDIVEPGYGSDMIARACEPGVRLVTSLMRARSASGLGGALESLQLHTFVTCGVAAWCALIGEPCVVGRSTMLRRSDLARIGSFEGGSCVGAGSLAVDPSPARRSRRVHAKLTMGS